MLQEYRKEGHGPQRPEGKLGLGVVISFQCQDALAIYREAMSRGIRPLGPSWATGCGSRAWPTRMATGSSLRAIPMCRRKRS